MRRLLPFLCVGTFLLTGCAAATPSRSGRDETANTDKEIAAVEAKFAKWAKEVPETPIRTTNDLVKGNTAFALDLYRQLGKKAEGNLICSPFSISDALAMTYAGAAGDTEKQMAKTLHFTLAQEKLHPAFASLLVTLKGRGEGDKQGSSRKHVRLDIANALWGQKGSPFRKEFLQTVETNYFGGVQEVDFAQKREEARQTINRWVEVHTAGKIKDLLRPENVSSDTRLVLTNAIYFQGKWSQPFEEQATKEEDFEIAPGKKVKAPLMRQSETFEYFENDDVQVVQLAYRGGLHMTVLLPKKRHGLAEVEKNLTTETLGSYFRGMDRRLGTVMLPRFKVHYRASVKDALSALGLKAAFTPAADFSGMTSAEKVFLDDVIHQTFIEVNEKGTEAAAASDPHAVKFKPPEVPPFTFRADQPFLFLIQDYQTRTLLFLGRVNDPRG